MRGIGLVVPVSPSLTDTPASCIFVPAKYGDWAKYGHKVWLTPFLQKLCADLERKHSSTRELLYHFRTVLDDPMLPYQLAKLGTTIRLLLCGERVLRDDAYLDPGMVGEALRAFAQTRSVRLPDGAVDALALAHRVALLGDRGISPRRIDVEDAVRSSDLLQNLETLRTTIASLVAALINYTGPVYQGLSDDRTSSRVHWPLLRPQEAARLADEREAARVFSAAEAPR